MSEKKWKTRPYKVVGYIGIFLIFLVLGVDLWLAIDGRYPTFSQYVSRRTVEQPLFGWFVLALIAYLAYHWLWGRIKL